MSIKIKYDVPIEIQRKLRKGIDLTEEEHKVMTDLLRISLNSEPQIDLSDELDELNSENTA